MIQLEINFAVTCGIALAGFLVYLVTVSTLQPIDPDARCGADLVRADGGRGLECNLPPHVIPLHRDRESGRRFNWCPGGAWLWGNDD